MKPIEKYPTDWTKDDLSEFLEKTYRNTLASFSNLRQQYTLLQEIEGCFRTITQNLNNTNNIDVAGFLIRAHSSYLASVRLGLAGQVIEAYSLLRNCLENAFYGIHIYRIPNLYEIWIRRDESEEKKKKVRKEFELNKMLSSLEFYDEKLKDICKLLYERTIDIGAHPNEKSITSIMNINEDDAKIEYRFEYLFCNNIFQDFCLISTAQVGICSLNIFKYIYRIRFDLLGLSDKVESLKKETERLQIKLKNRKYSKIQQE